MSKFRLFKANEYSTFVKTHLDYHIAQSGKEGSFLFGKIFVSENYIAKDGEAMPVHGILAYAGVSKNNRLYLPEHLATGHERQLPLRINHSSILGMEQELHRLPQDIQQALMRGESVEVGELKLTCIRAT